MSKQPNIIQKREVEPLLLKANKAAKTFEKAAGCAVTVLGPDFIFYPEKLNPVCRQCKRNSPVKPAGCCIHSEAVREAKKTRQICKYTCAEGNIFWISPFYSGEIFAGALLCGGIKTPVYNCEKIKSLTSMISMVTDKLSKHATLSSFYTNQKTIFNDSNEKNNKPTTMVNMDMERKMLANLRRGDNTEAKNILSVLLITHFQETGLNFEAFKLRAIELAVLLSRSADNTDFETNNRYLKKINESCEFEEIKQILCVITDNMSEKIFSFHGIRHFAVLRRAERFIWENYTRKLSLEEIAKVSGLSAPYFSTIFKEEMGENLSNYLNKLRVDKAKDMLVSTTIPISEISASCGFEDQSWFSKIFRNNTGMTPGKYRENKYGG